MYSTTLTADVAWITDPTNPTGPPVQCGTNLSQGIQGSQQGEVRHYPGGYVEAVVFDQYDVTMPIVLVHLSAADLAQIRAWRGRTILIRTTDGERIFGVYFETNWQRRINTTPDVDDGTSTTYDVSITIQQVTFDETLVN